MTTLIRDTRECQGVSLRELARRCGVAPSTVVDWERTESHDGAAVGTIRRALRAMHRELDIHAADVGGPENAPLFGFSQRVQRELHRLYAAHLLRDPGSALNHARLRVVELRMRTRGDLSASWVDEWSRLIDEHDVPGLLHVMVGGSSTDVEMRQLSPFAGILDHDERALAVARARV